MKSKYLWQYFLVVPAAAVAAADAVAPALDNPDGIAATFRRYPRPNPEGEYLEPAKYWAASFMACDRLTDGNPSRQALEGSVSQHTALAALRWVRTKNPHHPDTPESDRNIVVASNWSAFPQGAIADWATVTMALTP